MSTEDDLAACNRKYESTVASLASALTRIETLEKALDATCNLVVEACDLAKDLHDAPDYVRCDEELARVKEIRDLVTTARSAESSSATSDPRRP